MTGDGEKVTNGQKFLSATLLTTSAKAAALNTACALSAALKGGCPLLFKLYCLLIQARMLHWGGSGLK